MDSNIEIQWLGQRKDGSSRGAVYGWFVMKGHLNRPLTPWEKMPDSRMGFAYVFRGRVGKKMHIEERELTDGFLSEISSMKKNFKTVDPERVMPQWGREFREELKMFITMLKLRS